MNPDLATIEELWHSHHARLLNYARHHIDYDQAEDVVQLAYLKACEAARKGKGYREDSSGWLFRIAHNLIIDLYRARNRTPETIELDAPADWDSRDPRSNGDTLPEDAMSPHELAEQVIVSEAVQRCIGTLNDKQRSVVLLLLEGFDYREIADLTDNTHGAVKALRVRGLQQLRCMINHDGSPAQLPVASHVADILRELLQEHGALSVPELAERTNIPYGTIYTLLSRDRTFCQEDAAGGVRLWSLAEQREAA